MDQGSIGGGDRDADFKFIGGALPPNFAIIGGGKLSENCKNCKSCKIFGGQAPPAPPNLASLPPLERIFCNSTPPEPNELPTCLVLGKFEGS